MTFKRVGSLIDGLDQEQLLTGTWYGGWFRVMGVDQWTPEVEANVREVLDEQSVLTLDQLVRDRGYTGAFESPEYVVFPLPNDAIGEGIGVGWRRRFRFEPVGGANP